MYYYHKFIALAVTGLLLPPAVSVGAAVTVTTADASGADAAFRATTPAVVEGNATTAISFDAANAPSALNIGAIALRFGVGASSTKDSATLSFVYRRNNTAGFTLYGLADSATGNNWTESTLTAAGAIANGWFTSDGSTLAATDSLVNLGTIALTGTAANTVRTYPTNGVGTDVAPNSALDSFLSADTDGVVTLLLVPSTARSPFFYSREAATSASLALPTLSFNATPTSTPEPAALSLIGLAAITTLRRRRA